MKLRVPSARERRIVLAAGVLAGVVLVPTRVLPALRAHRDEQRAAARELATELARAEASASTLPWIRDTLVDRRERYLALASRILSGRGPSAGGAALASFVSGSARAANLRLGSVQLRADTIAVGGFIRVRIDTDVTGDIRGMTSLLLALERGPLLLRVRRFAVTQPAPGAAPEEAEALRAELIVEGLALARGEDGAK